MEDKEVFSKQIDYKNKAIPVPQPSRIQDIDTDDSIYDDLLMLTDDGTNTQAISELESFTNVSHTRDSLYDAIDTMCEDARISSAVDIYTSIACEPNDKGQIVWAVSSDDRVAAMVNHLLDSMNVDKFAYQWMCSLVKYGDLYLRLYRESEVDEESSSKETLNEAVIVKAFKDSDPFIEFTDMHSNPAEMFELQKRGKTVAYIRTHIPDSNSNLATDSLMYPSSFLYKYNFDTSDVDLFPADSYVHACLDDTNSKYREEVVLGSTTDEERSVTYSVRRGRSLLYDAYKIWRTLSLLENAIVLNRLTKSSLVKIIQVETSDMDKSKVRPFLTQLKQNIKQKTAIDVNNNLTESPTMSPSDNIIFLPVHDGKNAVQVQDIGSTDVKPQLDDLDYFRKKLFSALGIPGAYLGEDDGTSGFDSGTNLTLKSSQFAKKIKRLQSCFAQAITDMINLILLDKKLYNYINEFTITMQAPMTEEEKTRKDNLSTTLNVISDEMRLITESGIEDPKTKLDILRLFLAEAGINPEVLSIIQEKAEEMAETGNDLTGEEGGESDFGSMRGGGGLDLGGGDLGGDLDLGGEGELDIGGGSADTESQPMETTPEETEPAEIEAPEESFTSGIGKEILNERNDLPSWDQLGISYTDVKLG